MPPEGIDHVPRKDLLSLEEVVELARVFVRWGVERVRLTGGEPTLRRNMPWLVAQLAGLKTASGAPLSVTMTTNGELLPTMAKELADAGLSGVTVSLDSLDPERFLRITRRGDLSKVLQGIEAARAAGITPIKLNAVAVAGFNDDEIGRIARWSLHRGIVPRFIEVMPMSGGSLFIPGELLAAAEIRGRVAAELGSALVPDDGEGVAGHGPATYWRVASGEFSGGRIGTIAAMTENFCASCNRLRVSATGQVHACLARDDAGDLRGALRSGEPHGLEAVVREVLGHKRDTHDFRLDGSGGPDKAMISIGG